MGNKINLVKYAGDYWVTLASVTEVRSTVGYSNLASVKSAIRTFVVKQDAGKYVAFRGEKQLKNIIQENIANPLFNADEFQGTRAGLIHFSMLHDINNRFTIDKKYTKEVKQFMEDANKFINKDKETANTNNYDDTDFITGRSAVLKQLRSEVNNIDKQMEVFQENRAKLLSAINALETLNLEPVEA